MHAPSSADRDLHLEIEQLLPWYVTGRLEPSEIEAVDTHLADCEHCRTLLAEERALHDTVGTMPFASPPTSERAPNPIPARDARWRQRAGRGWAGLRRSLARPRKPGWFLAAQAATIAAVIGLLQWHTLSSAPSDTPSPAAYRTLSAASTNVPAANAGNIVVVFAPTATEIELRRILRLANATIVDGPTSTDAYVLRVADGRRDAVVRALRAEAAIALAEPIDIGNAP
jgi:anti-sigma factor RsiW